MKGERRFIDLKPDKVEELTIGFKSGNTATYRRRCHIILLSDQGQSIGEIAEIYNIVRQTVTNTFNRFEKAGIKGLQTKKGQGKKPIIRIENEAQTNQIEKLVEKNSQNLNAALAEIKKEVGLEMSKVTLQRFLKKKVALETFPKNLSSKARPNSL